MAIALVWSLGLLNFSLCSSFLNEEIYTEWLQTFRTHADKGLLSLHFTLIHMQLVPLLQPSLKEEALLLALLISVAQHLNITAGAPQHPSVIAATALLDSNPSTVWSSDDESGLAQPFTASHPLGLPLTSSSGCNQLARHHCSQMASSCSSQLPTKRSMLLLLLHNSSAELGTRVSDHSHLALFRNHRHFTAQQPNLDAMLLRSPEAALLCQSKVTLPENAVCFIPHHWWSYGQMLRSQ